MLAGGRGLTSSTPKVSPSSMKSRLPRPRSENAATIARTAAVTRAATSSGSGTGPTAPQNTNGRVPRRRTMSRLKPSTRASLPLPMKVADIGKPFISRWK